MKEFKTTSYVFKSSTGEITVKNHENSNMFHVFVGDKYEDVFTISKEIHSEEEVREGVIEWVKDFCRDGDIELFDED